MLRTSNELIRYDVEATDGKIGCVKDVLFDDRSWRIGAIVVDTGSFLSHHKVLIDPAKIRALKFPDETVVLALSKKDLESSPGLETSPPVSEQHSSHEHPGGQVRDRRRRSCNEVSTYRVSARDAAMGTVHGLIIETSTWTIRYLIVDTGDWLTGKLVLLSPQVIERIDWSSHSVKVNVTTDVIRHSPAYDETAELGRDYEAFLHDYYGWPPYWH